MIKQIPMNDRRRIWPRKHGFKNIAKINNKQKKIFEEIGVANVNKERKDAEY